uniref:PEST proteolytic signal-containing nuclear protein n=1 Tax=Pyxicephalus adspersus TaxID=30357 RepID=A0AAV3B2Z0_PYXAD|nr:TPA: hypothetical protein GDO54_001012 [Pyxicephalus adspersus]
MADQKGRQGGPEEEAENEVQTKTVSSSNGGESSSRNAEKRSADTSSEESSTQPCPAKVSKIGFAVGSQIGKKSSSISIKLGGTKLKDVTPAAVPKKSTVAAVFNDEDDCINCYNICSFVKLFFRDTPTSAGPNSFNKGKHGFTDTQKLWERNIKSQLDPVKKN